MKATDLFLTRLEAEEIENPLGVFDEEPSDFELLLEGMESTEFVFIRNER